MENIVYLENFRYGLGAFCVKQGRKERWGIMDTGGNVVVEPYGERVRILSPDIVALWKPGRYNGRCFDIVRRKFIPGIWCDPCRRRVVTKKGNREGLEDLDGNVIIPHKYTHLEFEKDGLIRVWDSRKDKDGIFNPDGTELLPVRYDDIRVCDKTLSFVKIADEWFVTDASGERPLKKQYDYLSKFNSKGYCIFGEKQVKNDVRKAEYMRFGLMDKDENILIPAIYDHLEWVLPLRSDGDDRLSCSTSNFAFYMPCSNLQYRVITGLRHGVIDCHGNEMVPCVYPEPLQQGPDRTYIANIPRMNYGKGEVAYPSVVSDTGYVTGVVDETGRIVLPFRDWRVRLACDAAFWVYDREIERCGLYSSSGEELLPIEFEAMADYGDTLDYIAVRKNGEWYYVNSRNERVLL